MIELIGLILFNSAVCVGFFAACQFEGDEAFDVSDKWIKKRWTKPTDVMVLWWVRYYGGRFIPPFWTKPVYACLPCMGSLHSIVPTILFCSFFGISLWVLPFVILATVGVNYLIQTVLWK